MNHAKDGGRGKGGPKAVRFRPAMDREEVESLVVVMLRSLRVRAEGVRVMAQDHFGAGERTLALAVRVLAEQADRYADADLVPYLDYRNAVAEAVAALGAGLTDDERFDLMGVPGRGSDACGLLHHAFRVVSDSEYTVSGALAQLARFAQERAVDRPLKRAMLDAGSGVVTDYASILDPGRALVESVALQKEEPWSTLGGIKAAGIVTAVNVVPTALAFVDHFLGGGMAAGEIYGITAGTGYGKSTLVHQIAIAAAQAFQLVAGRDGSPPRLVVVFSYEDTKKDIFNRSLACAARIKRSVLEGTDDLEESLLRVPSLYDAALAKFEGWDDVPGRFPTEYERYRKAFEDLDRNYIVVDMTEDGLGDGGYPEVVAILARIVEKTGQQPGLVVVDSIDLLTSNFLEANHSAMDAHKLLANKIPSDVHKLKRRVAVRYACSVLVTNQLAGEMLSRGAGARLSHANAGLSKSWAKPLALHAVLGAQTEEKVAMLDVTKSRRGGHQGLFKLIKLDGDFGRWLDVSLEYRYENGEIVKKSVVESVRGPLKPRVSPRTSAANFEELAE